MHKLIEYICDELEELERKADKDGKLTMQEVQYMDTLAHAKKNLLKSEMMEDEDGYSGTSYSMDGRYAYERDGRRMYSNARRGNVRRDAMGRYSREDDFRTELEELIHDAPNEHVRQKLKTLMSEM